MAATDAFYVFLRWARVWERESPSITHHGPAMSARWQDPGGPRARATASYGWPVGALETAAGWKHCAVGSLARDRRRCEYSSTGVRGRRVPRAMNSQPFPFMHCT